MKITIVLLFSIFCLFNCNFESSCDLNHVLPSMRQELYDFPITGWTVRQENVFDDSTIYYDLVNSRGDTSFNLRFNLFCSEQNYSKGFDYKISWFEKIYSDSLYRHNLIMMYDTVIYYKTPVMLNSKKEFLVGKYYYMLTYPDEFEKMGFTDKHFIFIHDNFDSLRHIRGDSLVFPF